MNTPDKICDNLEVNRQLLELYNLIASDTKIQYTSDNLKEYFEKIYDFMTLKRNENLLKNAECLSMYNFYIFLCKKLGMIESENHSDINNIPPNCVISIEIPAVPGYYHFITAVVSYDKKFVDIYQSYGGSRILYSVLNLPFSDFIIILKDCKLLSDDKTSKYYDDMLKLRRISRVFSRIMNLECKALENEQQTFAYDYYMDKYEDDDEEEEEEEIDPLEDPQLDKLMDVNFPNKINDVDEDDRNLGFTNEKAISIIRRDYQKFKTQYSFSMKIFTPPIIGGKKKRKTKKLRKGKKIKKTRRHKK